MCAFSQDLLNGVHQTPPLRLGVEPSAEIRTQQIEFTANQIAIRGVPIRPVNLGEHGASDLTELAAPLKTMAAMEE